MKHITRIALLLFLNVIFIYGLNAQTAKGSWLLGGTANINVSGYNPDNAGDFTNFGISFNPNVSYFVIDHFSVGILIPLSFHRSIGDAAENQGHHFEIGPHLRYYFPFSKMAIFPEVSYTWGKSRNVFQSFDPSSGQTVETTVKGVLQNFAIGAGFTYFINPSIGIEAILQYSKSRNETNQNFGNTKFSDIDLNFGFQIYLNRERN